MQAPDLFHTAGGVDLLFSELWLPASIDTPIRDKKENVYPGIMHGKKSLWPMAQQER